VFNTETDQTFLFTFETEIGPFWSSLFFLACQFELKNQTEFYFEKYLREREREREGEREGEERGRERGRGEREGGKWATIIYAWMSCSEAKSLVLA
jgi:hypothetical protein